LLNFASMKKIRCAIIGLGMGKHHLRSYLKNPLAEVVGLVDTNSELLEALRETHPHIPAYTDYKKMLVEARPDLVSVVLPNFLHRSVSVDCMEAGAHVLCEKPMSVNLDEAMKMEMESNRLGKKIFMNLSQRFGAFNLKGKSLCESGALGEIYQGYASWTRRDGMPRFGGWFGQQELSGGGPLIDLGVHRIDLAMWLMGAEIPVTVTGVTHHRRGIPRAKAQGKAFDVEDFASGMVRFSNGACLLFEISWAGYQKNWEKQEMRLIGDKGALEIYPGDKGMEMFFSHDLHGEALVSQIVGPSGEAPYSCETLVHCLAEDKAFPAVSRDGIRMQIILEALYQSASEGREISVKDRFPEALDFLYAGNH